MDREAFIDWFHIVLKVQVIGRMRRPTPDPAIAARASYEALRLAGGRMTLECAGFMAIVAPALASLFCNRERGKPFDARILAGAIFDALRQAGEHVTTASHDTATAAARSARKA